MMQSLFHIILYYQSNWTFFHLARCRSFYKRLCKIYLNEKVSIRACDIRLFLKIHHTIQRSIKRSITYDKTNSYISQRQQHIWYSKKVAGKCIHCIKKLNTIAQKYIIILMLRIKWWKSLFISNIDNHNVRDRRIMMYLVFIC